ncbi:Wzz/FepE/Etk N-terminal domain-containing protein [Pedobacter sp. PLR]|uniref:Wzz/FepE/Etk N-terminal domain-containing protein n=1 Tax=Pedobacter sp. PLR TaxID=2994465 RepID=UPI0022482BA7|nr:Wzz/FepE/Etk N-terminal domain-containing protein [Pedobacter sp. PLR]MCX2453381.1 Wzz/FepE/Etk N-terminal domain-containing protein [Pedobacter sp. PLR]
MNLENKIKQSEVADEISLKEVILKIKDLYRYLLSKTLLILSLAFFGAVIGFGYAYFKKPNYTASTTFVLEEGGAGASGGLGGLGGLASMVGIDVGSGGGIFQGDNILELYKSRKMIEKTLLTPIEYEGGKQLLINRYIDFNKLKEKWVNKPELTNISFDFSKKFTRLQDSIIGTIVTDINKNYLTVGKPDKKLSIIKVDVKSEDEFFSKSFDDNMVMNVNDFYLQTKTKKSLENIAILQQKTDSVRMIMSGAIYSSASTIDATPNLNPTRQVLRAPVQRAQFNAEANKTILGELLKNLELSKISLRKETPLIQVIDQPIFPLEKDKIGKIKATLIGGVIGGFLTVLFLLVKRFFKSIMA